GNVGRLTAISTFGSFAGTILIGYVLIPRRPNSQTMYITSCALMVVVLIYFIVWRDKKQVIAPVLLMAGLAALLGYGGVRRDGLQRGRELARINAKETYYRNSN